MARKKLILILSAAFLPLFVVSMAGSVSAQQPPAANKEEKKVKKSWEEKLPDPDPEEVKIKGTEETLEGLVSGAGYNGLAVEVPNPKKNEASEVWLNYVKGLKLTGIQSLTEIQEGDTVRVSYKKAEDGRKFLKEIRLIRKKPAEEILVSTETPEETEEEETGEE